MGWQGHAESRAECHCIKGIKTKNTKPNLQAVESGVTEQGDWVFACNEAFNLLACVWFDSGICHFMSNMHNTDGSVIEPSKKRHRGKLTVTCPLVAAHYNIHMTAIDDIDQVRELLSVQLRIRKWYLVIFFFLIDTCTNN